jgi:hypothetical protein
MYVCMCVCVCVALRNCSIKDAIESSRGMDLSLDNYTTDIPPSVLAKAIEDNWGKLTHTQTTHTDHTHRPHTHTHTHSHTHSLTHSHALEAMLRRSCACM